MTDSTEHNVNQTDQPDAAQPAVTEPADEPIAYPVRQARDDPRWAVRVAWTWLTIAVSLLLFFVVLLLLGIWYD